MGIERQCTREGEKLSLSVGKRGASFTYFVIVSLGQARHEVGESGLLTCSHQACPVDPLIT